MENLKNKTNEQTEQKQTHKHRNRLVVAIRDGMVGWVKLVKGKKVQAYNYKINQSWGMKELKQYCQ